MTNPTEIEQLTPAEMACGLSLQLLTIERLQNEALAATIRIDNDAAEIASLKNQVPVKWEYRWLGSPWCKTEMPYEWNDVEDSTFELHELQGMPGECELRALYTKEAK